MVLDPDELERMMQREISRLAEEFQGTFSRETVERCARESLVRLPGANITKYLPTFAYRFARERLRAQAGVDGLILTNYPRVLFVCTRNAARSQMAAALLRRASRGEIQAHSAGSAPATEIDPAAVAVMDEIGIDLSREFPKPVTDEVVAAVDVVVTMGCGDACALYPFKKYEDWPIPDPSGQPLDGVRAIRDEIRTRVERLRTELLAPTEHENL